jgi:capsular exopolysaccharide synthesis family protein
MSRIYEALRQAELDSTKRADDEPTPANQSDAAAPIVPDAVQAAHAVEAAPATQAAPTTKPAPLAEAAPAAPIAMASAQAVPDAVLEATPVRATATPAPVPEPIRAAAPSPQPIPSVFRRTVPVAPPATAVSTPSAPVTVSPTAMAPVDEPLGPDNIAQYAWVPSLHQLPALEHRGAAVEQFRSLRSRMQEFRDLNTLKSILVSSGLPQEGKSFVAANLAISFARHKASRVLLIDGDMRRSSLHKLLGAPQGPGLTEYLAGKATLAEIMQRAKPSDTAHPLPNGLVSLAFIPGGHSSDKAADLAGNRRFDRLIADAAAYFDWIVVDSSPVNLVSDGVNLARSCDGVLLIARGGTTKYAVAQRALAELKASKVLGFVLNAVEDPPAAGGYYGYDGYDTIEE